MAFYRTFAIPRIAALLHHTGEIERQPLKRAIDTGLLMYELIAAGVDSDRGKAILRSLNQMHRRWPIEQEDYTYVLSAFIVVPVRWTAANGRRAYTGSEREAVTAFYQEVGRRMGIRALPERYDAAATLLDAFEERHQRPSPEGNALMAVTGEALEVLLPRPLRRVSGRLTALMLEDRMCEALGVRPPSPAARWAFGRAMQLRRLRYRRRPPASGPAFRPGRSGSAVYPHGYAIEDLGVQPVGGPSPRE